MACVRSEPSKSGGPAQTREPVSGGHVTRPRRVKLVYDRYLAIKVLRPRARQYPQPPFFLHYRYTQKSCNLKLVFVQSSTIMLFSFAFRAFSGSPSLYYRDDQ